MTPAAASEPVSENLLQTIRQLRKENAELKKQQIDIRAELDRISTRHAQEREEAQAHRRRELELQKITDLLTQLASRQLLFEETVFGQISTLDSMIREGFDLPDDPSAYESDLCDLPEGTFSEQDSDSAISFQPSSRSGLAKKAKRRPPSPTASSFVPHPSFAPFFGASSPGSGRPPTAAMSSSRLPASTAGCADRVGSTSSSASTTLPSSGAGSDSRRDKPAAQGPAGLDSTPATLHKKTS